MSKGNTQNEQMKKNPLLGNSFSELTKIETISLRNLVSDEWLFQQTLDGRNIKERIADHDFAITISSWPLHISPIKQRQVKSRIKNNTMMTVAQQATRTSGNSVDVKKAPV